MRNLCAFAMLSLLLGCGGGADGPKTVDVSGKVTLKGTPLANADVHFYSNDGKTYYGRTGDDGAYHLVKGAVPGDYKVFFTKMDEASQALDPESGMDAEQLRAAAEGAADPATGEIPKGLDIPKDEVPDEYNNPKRTKITFTVPDDGTTSADFKL